MISGRLAQRVARYSTDEMTAGTLDPLTRG